MAKENRYVVFKIKDMKQSLTISEQKTLQQLSDKVDKYRVGIKKTPLKCVVVEHDWPEYEPTWNAILRNGER